MKILSLLIASALLAGSASLSAHSDPYGDIHPKVSVEDGKFIVRAEINDGSYGKASRSLQMTLDSDGNLKAEKREVGPHTDKVPNDWYLFIDQLSEEQNGLELAWRDGALIVPEGFSDILWFWRAGMEKPLSLPNNSLPIRSTGIPVFRWQT